MPIYQYTVKNKHGETVRGKVEARNESLAVNTLNSRQLFVVNLKPVGEDSLAFIRELVSGVKKNDIVNFTRQLATMINAGLPLATALNILQDQSNAEMSRLVSSLLKDIETGKTFSQSLARHGKHFSRVYIQLVKAGELGGVLDNVLNRLADTMEKEKEFRSKTKGAMIYPIIVVIAMIAVFFVMMIFMVPKLTQMYQDFDADLPIATKILIGISSFFVNFWWLMLGAIAGGIAAFKSWMKTKQGQFKVDGILFKIPIIGKLRKKILLTEFARTMSLLLSTGVSLLKALDIVSESMNSIIYRTAFQEAAVKIEKGVSMSDAMAGSENFPPILEQMMAVGEETGKLDEVLMKLSAYFESESEQAVKNLTTAIEPIIMIVLGVGVGAMVLAIIMPIYNLTSQF